MTRVLAAGDAFAQPDDVVRAQVVGERLPVVLAAEAGVAHPDHRVQQAFLGGQDVALAVHVDAALQHDPLPVPRGREQPPVQERRRPGRREIVILPVRILGPGREAEIHQLDQGTPATSPLTKAGPQSRSQPRLVGARRIHAGDVRADLGQQAAGLHLLGFVVHEQAHPFAGKEFSG